MMRFSSLFLGLLLLFGVGLAQAQRAALPTVWWGRPLNQGLTDWWLVTPSMPRGLSLLQNLANPSRHGTLAGLATVPTATSGVGSTSRRGGWGELRTDGAGDTITSTAVPLTGLTSFTVALWIQTTTATSDAIYMAKGGSGQYSWNLSVSDSPAGGVRWTSYDCAGSINRATLNSASIPIQDGRWHHIAATYQDGVRVELFVDGRLDATTTTFVAGTFCASSTAAVTLAVRGATDGYFPGKLDDARIWKRILAAAEIRKVYEDSLAGYPETLITLPGGQAPLVTVRPRSRSRVY